MASRMRLQPISGGSSLNKTGRGMRRQLCSRSKSAHLQSPMNGRQRYFKVQRPMNLEAVSEVNVEVPTAEADDVRSLKDIILLSYYIRVDYYV